jgi:hydroxyacylglutathione hydrolase
MFQEIDVHDAHDIIQQRAKDIVVLDVRNPDEYWGELGHIKGSIFIPIDTLPMNLDKLEAHKDKEIICICYSGPRSRFACQILAANGFKKLYNVVGGMGDWGDANYEVEGQNTWPNVPK